MHHRTSRKALNYQEHYFVSTSSLEPQHLQKSIDRSLNGVMSQISLKFDHFIFIIYAKIKVNTNTCEFYEMCIEQEIERLVCS